MHDLLALGAGLIAGLALVVPLGAIGVLLIQEGASRGWTGGVPAAVAVASVDILYCAAAVTTGSAVAPVIALWAPWPPLVGGIALIAIAVRSLIRGRRPSPDEASGGATDTSDDTGTGVRDARSWRRFAAFFALTAANPATVVYFAAVITGLSSIGASPASAALFVAGVGIASVGWQAALVAVGALLLRRTGAGGHRLTALIGNGLIVAFGLLMIAEAVL
ncbi:threonine/homoserine/homoserine lactone efflux protein [Microbacterium resistens]|uniref:Threonine/homoserine/homoserine lactone efflux protein n=1 Tax=Microbacterium resistens TaxID=156977 RepID=A0ABU1SAG7_9MICO|nr:LysE family transporter [Microbacterium resistens]MDR6865913.1 threonine/homoserine/homoserine lactone efflux protein [Microbacterium resistens]